MSSKVICLFILLCQKWLLGAVKDTGKVPCMLPRFHYIFAKSQWKKLHANCNLRLFTDLALGIMFESDSIKRYLNMKL